MAKRNYAHCPLKKRPLALYNEPAHQPEQTQPEDLSVKRPKLECVVNEHKLSGEHVQNKVVKQEEKTYTPSTPSSVIKVVSSSRLFSLPVPSEVTTTSPVPMQQPVQIPQQQPAVPFVHQVVKTEQKQHIINTYPVSENVVNDYHKYSTSSSQPKTHVLPPHVPSRPSSFTQLVVPARNSSTSTSQPQPQKHYFTASNHQSVIHNTTPIHPSVMQTPPPQVPPHQPINQFTPTHGATLVQRPELNQRLSPPQAAGVKSSESGNLPTLAEYYLQLFKATSEAEKKPEISHLPPNRMGPMPWNTSYLPPSPQASPNTPDHFSHAPITQTPNLMSPQNFTSYPESSALISPVSTCSSIPSDDEEDQQQVINSTKTSSQGRRDTRYSCDDCGKSYSTYSGLNKHKQFHCSALGTRSFDCKHCDKTYTSLGALKMHIRTHTLPCKCHLCGKAFSRPWLLQGHIRTHTGEKPFQCNQCDRCFADRSNLRAHLQTHADVKKYACEHCHKTFSRMSLLTKHMETACPAGVGPKDNSSDIKLENHPDSPASSIEDVEH